MRCEIREEIEVWRNELEARLAQGKEPRKAGDEVQNIRALLHAANLEYRLHVTKHQCEDKGD